jgi:ubiquinone/menaquinone biosynthesis C-methylase UbiE
MALVNWRRHYEVRFGSTWYFTEILYRLPDLRVLVNFNSILGVGSGRAFTENLFSKYKFVIASDKSAKLVHITKKHARNIKAFMVCDGFKLPFKTQSFECVFSQGLLEHFDLKAAILLLKEMGRVGETVVFSVPLDKYRGQAFGKEYRRKSEEWLEFLSKIFRFTKALLYLNKREAVFVVSNKPLSKIRRFGDVEVLKRLLLALKPSSKTTL